MEKTDWNKISEEIVDALSKVAKKHGVTFETNGFTYGSDNCTFKTLALVNEASGQKRDLEREAFLSLCGMEKTQERMQAILMTGKPLRN